MSVLGNKDWVVSNLLSMCFDLDASLQSSLMNYSLDGYWNIDHKNPIQSTSFFSSSDQSWSSIRTNIGAISWKLTEKLKIVPHFFVFVVDAIYYWWLAAPLAYLTMSMAPFFLFGITYLGWSNEDKSLKTIHKLKKVNVLPSKKGKKPYQEEIYWPKY